MPIQHSTIALPTEPTKPGYNFGGWRLRATLFDLSTLASYISQQPYLVYSKNFAGNECVYHNENNADNDIESNTCTEPEFAHLNNGEWSLTFNYGSIKGRALCSENGVDLDTWGGDSSNVTATESELITAGTGENCWCNVTGFAAPGSSLYRSVVPVQWVEVGGSDFMNVTGNTCVNVCADACSYIIASTAYNASPSSFAALIRLLYGITQ